MYTPVCKCKMIPVETVQGIRGRRRGERSEGGIQL
jgi:hypothetical protein